MRNYNVTIVRFDFEHDGMMLDVDKHDAIVNEVLGHWVADDEDDLVGAISDYTGWCVAYIKYEEI
jgi:hypothetical protein